MLFNPKSLDQCDTLYQMKMAFEHRNVSSKAMDCYNHLADFMRFTSESYTVLLALTILNIQSMTDVPKNAPKEAEGADSFLKTVSHNIVEQIWHQIPMFDVASV